MIEVQHLTKRYGRVTAVDDVSFRVERGEILGFLGPERRRQDDDDAHPHRLHAGDRGQSDRRRLRCLRPADRSQAPHRLPAGNAAALSRHERPRIPRRSSPRSKACPAGERRERGRRRSMERTRIADMANRAVRASCRKGYRQRVGLAQALIHNPDVLILDEPTAGLDPKQIIETRQLIKELAGDHTVILSTHILPEVSQTCQRVVIINKGRVVAIDTPDNLTARLRGSETMYVQVDADGRRRGRAARARFPASRAWRRRTDATALDRLRNRQRARPRRAPRSRARGRVAAAGDCSSCGRCA